MTRKERMPQDPVVQEVRQARAELWKEGGGTIESFIRVVEKYASRRPTRRRRVAKNTKEHEGAER